MSTELRDLIKITDLPEKFKTDTAQILFDALEDKISLYVLSDKNCREALIPCKHIEHFHASPGDFIHQYIPLMDQMEYVDIKVAQPLRINKQALKELIVNKSFSEVELYRELAVNIDNQSFDFWKTELEIHNEESDLSRYASVGIDKVVALKEEVINTKKTVKPSGSDLATNTSLKVVGLLMKHLAKTPKYASGSSPNKSEIKKLLLTLADEFDIDAYGLNKVDERLLADAMKYLEEQKL